MVGSLAAENIALRQQLIVLSRNQKRPLLKERDRLFWVLLSRIWSGWRDDLRIELPARGHVLPSFYQRRFDRIGPITPIAGVRTDYCGKTVSKRDSGMHVPQGRFRFRNHTFGSNKLESNSGAPGGRVESRTSLSFPAECGTVFRSGRGTRPSRWSQHTPRIDLEEVFSKPEKLARFVCATMRCNHLPGEFW